MIKTIQEEFKFEKKAERKTLRVKLNEKTSEHYPEPKNSTCEADQENKRILPYTDKTLFVRS